MLPKNPGVLTEKDYEDRYANGRRVFTAGRDQLLWYEEKFRTVFCRMCLQDDEMRRIIKAAQLLVTTEECPLDAVGQLAHATCHQCGFEMHVNLDKGMVHKDDLDQMKKHMNEEDHQRRLMEECLRNAMEKGDTDQAHKLADYLYPGVMEVHREIDMRCNDMQRQRAMSATMPPPAMGIDPRYYPRSKF